MSKQETRCVQVELADLMAVTYAYLRNIDGCEDDDVKTRLPDDMVDRLMDAIVKRS